MMLTLSGIAVVVAGFALGLNPLLVVLAAALVTGLAGGIGPVALLAAFGHAWNQNRLVTLVYLVLPVIGLLERHGLQARAAALVRAMKGATVGRLLIAYLAFRQISAALGLIAIAGPAQTVRPLVAPMADAAAEAQGAAPHDERILALAAATDNVGVFFGEDIFVAMGSILLMKGIMAGYGVDLAPFRLSIWAIPAAIAAFLIHGGRLWWLDRRLARGGAR